MAKRNNVYRDARNKAKRVAKQARQLQRQAESQQQKPAGHRGVLIPMVKRDQ